MEQEKKYLHVEIYKANDLEHHRLINLFDILDGTEILVPIQNSFEKMTVTSNGSAFFAQNEKYLSFLEFDKDERHCWCSVGIARKDKLLEGKVMLIGAEKDKLNE